MKRILIFACLLSLAVAQSTTDIFEQYTTYMKPTAEKCVEELGLPEDIVDRFVTEKHSEDIETMGCLRACTLTKLGIMVNGEISLDAANELIAKISGQNAELAEQLRKSESKCKENTKHFGNQCELAMEFFNCSADGLKRVLKKVD